MADIFLSYQRDDRAIAERLVAALSATGRSVWWDDALTPHQAWDASIEREIEASRAVIVLWSPRSVQSDWVRTEAHYAQDHNKLVPVVVEGCHLPLAFALRQAVDLSDGVFDDSSPAWRKLLGWVSDVVDRDRSGDRAPPPVLAPSAAAPAPAPAPAATPLWRKPLVLGGGAVAALLLAVLAWFTLGNGASERPPLYVDTIELTQGVPANLAANLQDEIIAGLSGSTRISPIIGDGKAHHDAYRIGGRLSQSGGKVQFFARLFAPGSDAPVLTTRLERTAGPFAMRDIAYNFAAMARCVATGGDGTGRETQLLPAAAMEPWARFCLQSNMPDGSADVMEAALEETVAAAPDFAGGWSTLAQGYFYLGYDKPAQYQEFWKKAADAVDRALKLDPQNAQALMVRANLALMKGVTPGADVPLRRYDFAAFDRLGREAIAAKPSECYCEMSGFGYYLLSLGQVRDAADMFQRSYELDHTHTSAAAINNVLGAFLGDTGNARRELAELSTNYPDRLALNELQSDAAIEAGDYAAAAAFTRKGRPSEHRDALAAILEARGRGDMAGAHALGGPLAAQATGGKPNPELLRALALAGYPDEAVTATSRLIRAAGFDWLSEVQGSEFAAMRQTAGFEQMVRAIGLFDYWKSTKKPPLFCAQPGAPGWCGSLS